MVLLNKKRDARERDFYWVLSFFIFIGFYHYVAFYGFYHYVAFYWVLFFSFFMGFMQKVGCEACVASEVERSLVSEGRSLVSEGRSLVSEERMWVTVGRRPATVA